ncbi:uncharacterized protein LOC144279417 [Eretmochelys imbricata]
MASRAVKGAVKLDTGTLRKQLWVTLMLGKIPVWCLSRRRPFVAEDGTRTPFFYKQCLSSYKSDIKVPISFTVGNGQYLRINTTQCNDADNCNSGALEVPKGSTTQCLVLNSHACDSHIAPCAGDETYHIDFTGEILNGPSSSPFQAKGCATASAQDIKPGTFLASGPYIYLCSRATDAPAEKTPTSPAPSGASLALGKFSFALYLPGLTGLLLVKLLS